jgi:ferritin heavy chain
MSYGKTINTQARPDRQTSPVASNQIRDNLVRLYEISYSIFLILSILIFSNYHEDNEGLINRQINLELYASYVYTAMSHYFDRYDVALKGMMI